jgi:dihydroorotate dehydrogenase electron transfer subunit
MTHLREIATVLANQAEGDCRLLLIRAPEIAAAARPFQFVLVKVPGEGTILRRPFSIFDAGRESLELLIRPVGEGTARICSLSPGESCDLTGPFGRAFEADEDTLFVAGGIGVAGLTFGLTAAARAGLGPGLIFGAKTSSQLYVRSRLERMGIDINFVTEDGTAGNAGRVTDYLPNLPSEQDRLLSEALGERLLPYAHDVIACGPRPMYHALHRALGDDARLYVLMEERMACGVGACRSCAVPSRTPGRPYVAACREGPLLEAAGIDWDRLGDDL